LEIARTVDRLESELDDLALRGLRAVGAARLGKLRLFVEEFQRVGAEHLAERLQTVCDCVERDDPAAAAALLRAQTSLRLFDRLLTVEVAAGMLGGYVRMKADTTNLNAESTNRGDGETSCS
jgi:hypothetical protein